MKATTNKVTLLAINKVFYTRNSTSTENSSTILRLADRCQFSGEITIFSN